MFPPTTTSEGNTTSKSLVNVIIRWGRCTSSAAIALDLDGKRAWGATKRQCAPKTGQWWKD